eukprot:3294661-Pyramimonas_sp.AAC.1
MRKYEKLNDSATPEADWNPRSGHGLHATSDATRRDSRDRSLLHQNAKATTLESLLHHREVVLADKSLAGCGVD